MIAALARRTGHAPPDQTSRARHEALTEIFGRSDLDLLRLSRAQLRRIIRHLLGHDPDFCPAALTVAIAMNYVGYRRFQASEPELDRELSLRETLAVGGHVHPEDRPEIERRAARKIRRTSVGEATC
jgi:hypothetical protein